MKLRGYIFSRPFMGERVPQHVQNIVIRNFCNINNYKFFLSASEYTMKNSFLILNKTINELDDKDGIVAYSIFQMPEDFIQRNKIFEKMLKLDKNFFFAVENLCISNNHEKNEINQLWEIKKTQEKIQLNLNPNHFK